MVKPTKAKIPQEEEDEVVSEDETLEDEELDEDAESSKDDFDDMEF